MKNIYEIVADLLKSNKRYVSEDGNLLKANVYSDAMTMNQELIEMLLNNDASREKFFVKINNNYIFDKQGFAWFVQAKEFLPDSYTTYTNKIGLSHENTFISKNNDVVLDFPYKDCILEGGQTKEDQKRNEIFYNETIANDEITRMLSPKVLGNAVRYSKTGKENNIKFEEDNLIIKGNNLIALYSLLNRYEGSIKCIYIDIPYNTGNDSFGYNDKFNHSSWLTFMKNRLEVAKKLLKKDGTIFIQCDDNEQAYLKVLCDEIFDPSNFVNCIAVKMSEATGVKMSHAKLRFPKLKEYILFYKMPDFKGFEEIDKYKTDQWDDENNIYLENFEESSRKN